MTLYKRGSRGAPVRSIQVTLNGTGRFKLTEDGIFGPRTDAAVRQFQRSKGLVADGIVGPNTLAAMNITLDAHTPPATPPPRPAPISVSYRVPAYAQPTTMSCWATAIAMMVAWRDRISIAPRAIADRLGYTTQFNTGGLHPEDTKIFRAWGLKWEPPTCYTVGGFKDLLDWHGPLWIAGNPNAPHVRVVTAIKGDGSPNRTMLTINDPAGGRTYVRTFQRVMGVMEALGASPTEMAMKKPIYLAHF